MEKNNVLTITGFVEMEFGQFSPGPPANEIFIPILKLKNIPLIEFPYKVKINKILAAVILRNQNNDRLTVEVKNGIISLANSNGINSTDYPFINGEQIDMNNRTNIVQNFVFCLPMFLYQPTLFDYNSIFCSYTIFYELVD